MFPTLLARTILCVAGRTVDRQLTRNIIYDARRNTLQVLQKCAQKTHGAELQSKSQAVVIATANRDGSRSASSNGSAAPLLGR